jgi:hypothetical protein
MYIDKDMHKYKYMHNYFYFDTFKYMKQQYLYFINTTINIYLYTHESIYRIKYNYSGISYFNL